MGSWILVLILMDTSFELSRFLDINRFKSKKKNPTWFFEHEDYTGTCLSQPTIDIDYQILDNVTIKIIIITLLYRVLIISVDSILVLKSYLWNSIYLCLTYFCWAFWIIAQPTSLNDVICQHGLEENNGPSIFSFVTNYL